MFGSVLIRPPTVAILAGLVLVGLAGCDTDDGRQLQEPTAEQRDAMPTTTSSTTTLVPGDSVAAGDADAVPVSPPATLADAVVADGFTLTGPWIDGGPIDPQYTCDGDDLAPLVAWTTPPTGTVELALVVTDPDAEEFVHYAVAGLPPTPGQLGAGVDVPAAIEGTNDFGNPGWGGPCPPAEETHTYRWTLYALAQATQLAPGFAGSELQAMALNTAFASAQFTGSYTRSA
jgi:Raf kinase inhibitor-like YbhB/YbcL family protein